MKTIQERLRAAAAVYNRDERPSDTYMLQAADEIDRLQAALKASDEALIAFADDQGGETWGTVYAFNRRLSTYSDAISAARSRKEPQS